jgi:hypothetical protein
MMITKRPMPSDAKPLPPVDCAFKPGDDVIYTNDYGLEFPLTVVGFTPKVPDEGWKGFIYVNSCSWWFPLKPASLRLAN